MMGRPLKYSGGTARPRTISLSPDSFEIIEFLGDEFNFSEWVNNKLYEEYGGNSKRIDELEKQEAQFNAGLEEIRKQKKKLAENDKHTSSEFEKEKNKAIGYITAAIPRGSGMFVAEAQARDLRDRYKRSISAKQLFEEAQKRG